MRSEKILRSALSASALAFGVIALPMTVMAQQKPITLIVPYGKGGGSDQLSRAMVKAVESISKSRFKVINIKKGAGLGALPDFTKLPADGYSVIEHIDDITSAYAIGAVEINPARDWKPLNIVQLTFSQLFIRADETRFTDWKSFLAYAKQKEKRVAIANVSYDGKPHDAGLGKGPRLPDETDQLLKRQRSI